MGCWVGLRSNCSLNNYFEIKFPFLHSFLQNSFQNYFKFLFFYNLEKTMIKKLFIINLICPKAKSAKYCLTKLFPIYHNKHWTIKRWQDNIPSSHCPTILYWRLSDFTTKSFDHHSLKSIQSQHWNFLQY